MCSSTSVSKTEFPEASPEEKALMNMTTQALLPSFLGQSGYDVSSTSTKIEDDPQWQTFQDQKNRAQEDRSRAETELAKMRQAPVHGRNSYAAQQQLNREIQVANQTIDQANRKQEEFAKDWEPDTSYQVRKMGSAEQERARGEALARNRTLDKNISDDELAKKDKTFGAVRKKYQEIDIATEKNKRELVESFMEKAQKFVDGDFSITKEQKDLIQKSMAPQRAALKEMFSNVRSEMDKQMGEVKRTGKQLTAESLEMEKDIMSSVTKTFDMYDKRIGETNIKMGNALDVIGTQILKTGQNLDQALNQTISTNRALMKMGIEDYTGQVTKQMNETAASLGREPTDPEYQKEIQTAVSREVERGSLNLAQMEAEGRLRITERTGSGLEDVYRQKAALAERTGMAREESALQRGSARTSVKQEAGQREMSIAERTGIERENIARSRANLAQQEGAANLGLEESAANMRFQVGAGMAPQQVGVGMNVAQYQDALAQQRILNAYGAMQAPYNIAQGFRQERMGQPTTTQTSTPSIFSSFMDFSTGAAKAFGGFI